MLPETGSITVLLSSRPLTAAIQVQITPRTGEVSIGDSKLFLCQGRTVLPLPHSPLANAVLRNTLGDVECWQDKETHFVWILSTKWSSLFLPAEEAKKFCIQLDQYIFQFSLKTRHTNGVAFTFTPNLLLILFFLTAEIQKMSFSFLSCWVSTKWKMK